MKKQLLKKLTAFIVLTMMFLGSTYAQWAVNGTNIYNSNTGKVGIGTGAAIVPAGKLTIKGAGSVPAASWVNAGAPFLVGFGETTPGNSDFLVTMASDNPAARGVMLTRRSRGTLAAPTKVVLNDYLGSILASGYDGTNFQNAAALDFYADGAVLNGFLPTRISLVTGSSAATRTERLKVGSTGDFTFNTNQLFIQKSTGFIGMGTNTPAVPLDVKSSSGYLGRFNGGSSMYLGLFENDIYRGYLGSYAGNDADVDFGTGGGNTSGSLHLTIQAVPKVTIDSTGNVGVGKTTPTSRLDVSGNSASTSPVINVLNNYVGTADVRGVSVVSKASDGWGIGVQSTGGYIGGYFTSDAGAYASTGYGVFASANGSAGTRTAVYGSASGGTVNNWGGYFPTKTYTSELRVGGEQGASGFVACINGKLIATEIRVQPTANWPDYVFRKDHKLMSLEQLEASINANQHLPGIPNAAEVKDNGIMVGEMQTKAMEKIEENTLYILQLNNKIKEVEQINNNKSKEMEQLNSKIKELELKLEALARLVK